VSESETHTQTSYNDPALSRGHKELHDFLVSQQPEAVPDNENAEEDEGKILGHQVILNVFNTYRMKDPEEEEEDDQYLEDEIPSVCSTTYTNNNSRITLSLQGEEVLDESSGEQLESMTEPEKTEDERTEDTTGL